MCVFVCVCVFSDFLYKSKCCGYLFELHGQVDAIQIGNHNICLYKVDKKSIGCNLKTTLFLDFALIGVCAVIKFNTVSINAKCKRFCIFTVHFVQGEWIHFAAGKQR